MDMDKSLNNVTNSTVIINRGSTKLLIIIIVLAIVVLLSRDLFTNTDKQTEALVEELNHKNNQLNWRENKIEKQDIKYAELQEKYRIMREEIAKEYPQKLEDIEKRLEREGLKATINFMELILASSQEEPLVIGNKKLDKNNSSKSKLIHHNIVSNKADLEDLGNSDDTKSDENIVIQEILSDTVVTDYLFDTFNLSFIISSGKAFKIHEEMDYESKNLNILFSVGKNNLLGNDNLKISSIIQKMLAEFLRPNISSAGVHHIVKYLSSKPKGFKVQIWNQYNQNTNYTNKLIFKFENLSHLHVETKVKLMTFNKKNGVLENKKQFTLRATPHGRGRLNLSRYFNFIPTTGEKILKYNIEDKNLKVYTKIDSERVFVSNLIVE